MLRLLTAGESHGHSLVAVLEGLPAGIYIDDALINHELKRRQHGHGRGKRMTIEHDEITIASGMRLGRTTGAPVSLTIRNHDFENWQDVMNIAPRRRSNKVAVRVTCPRPGHADLPGLMKYGHEDIRDVIERASARETAIRVAAGALCKQFLKLFGILFYSHTVAIGTVSILHRTRRLQILDSTPLRCSAPDAEAKMLRLIDQAQVRGDSLGGISEVIARNVCPGLGSYVHYDRRLDAKIGLAMLSIPSVKGLEIGPAFANSAKSGANVQDEIFYKKSMGFYRKTNRAGGIEGGMTNGEDIVIRLIVKPVPTLSQPLVSVNIYNKKKECAHRERADTCVVPAAGVIGEAMLAYLIADAFLEKFGSDSIDDITKSYHRYKKRIENGS